MKRFDELSAQERFGIFMSLLAIPGWGISFVLFFIFAHIFDIELKLNHLALCLIPPILLIGMGVFVNFFSIASKWNLRPFLLSYGLTAGHGVWALIVGFLLPPEINGYLYVFLFAFGLRLIDIGLNFRQTVIFTTLILSITGLCIWFFAHQVGPDDLIFFFFCAFYGFASALVNDIHSRRYLQLRIQLREIEAQLKLGKKA